MRIAICSDIHDNMLTQLAEGFEGPVHVVWGNNDGDKWLLTRNTDRAGNVTLHGELAELELGGARVAVTHYPAVARGLAASGRYDLVCYGPRPYTSCRAGGGDGAS